MIPKPWDDDFEEMIVVKIVSKIIDRAEDKLDRGLVHNIVSLMWAVYFDPDTPASVKFAILKEVKEDIGMKGNVQAHGPLARALFTRFGDLPALRHSG